MNKKIIFSTGGTGGHIFPAVNLMKHFFDEGYNVLLVTDIRGENYIKNYSQFKSYVLKADTVTKKNIINKLYSLLIIFYSIIKSIFILRKEKPDLIIGFGGYVSFPISFASKFFNLPLFIYESNLTLGRANKYLLPFAKKVILSKLIKKNFPKKFENKICESGPILSKNIINQKDFKKNNIKENFVILVLGGSQGAEIFGRVVPYVIEMIKKEGFNIEIKQQCISSQTKSLVEYYQKNYIKNYIFEFDKDISKHILSSDLVITRSGATTTAELVHMQTPFIAIPLPNSIDNHQYLNAKFYEENGCCWILDQNNFNNQNLFNLIIEIIKNKNKLEIVSNNMKKNYSNKAYSIIEDKIKEFI